MIEKIINRYTLLLLILFTLHVITVTINGFLTYFDFLIIVYILLLDIADEENYIPYAFIFGFFTDYIRDGIFGPGVILFLVFYLIRFKTDVIMDMTKIYYKILLYSGMSFTYCMYNLLITEYSFYNGLYIAFYRTVLNVSVVFIVLFFFKGYRHVAKNA